jgi:chorismate dehydratase
MRELERVRRCAILPIGRQVRSGCRKERFVIRIGSVPYLNSKVLVHGLQPQTERYTFETHVPSVLTQKLREAKVDIALVSCIEYFRQPNAYCILPDLSVSSQREMWSIQLFYRGELRNLKRAATDPSSQTTNALMHIILREKLGLGTELVPLRADEDPLARPDLDGFLKIGDPCLQFIAPPGYSALDLASEWHAFTNLPFVFAVWLARSGVDLEGMNTDLFLAKREGLRRVDDIAKFEAPQLGLEVKRAKDYISKIVRYDLGREEVAGLDLFRRYLIKQKLVEPSTGFDFYTR